MKAEIEDKKAESLPLLKSIEFNGVYSNKRPGHEERIAKARERVLTMIFRLNRHKKVRGQPPNYHDPLSPGSLRRCIGCGAETVDSNDLLARKGWKQELRYDPLVGLMTPLTSGHGVHTAEAWTCGRCHKKSQGDYVLGGHRHVSVEKRPRKVGNLTFDLDDKTATRENEPARL